MSSTHKTELPPPPPNESVLLSFPAPHILLVTINRPRQMNSIPFPVHWHLHRVFDWFDREPSLRVAVITGAGPKSFCAGQDLIELGKRDPKELEEKPYLAMHPSSGFAGISRRLGKKPIVAAVNGFALGGGFEIVLNWSVTPFLSTSLSLSTSTTFQSSLGYTSLLSRGAPPSSIFSS